VYDYVSSCYKAAVQRTCYMNTIHPMEMHDIGLTDNQMGCVVRGDAINEDFNRRILLNKTARKRGRLQSRRRESNRRGRM